MMKNTDWKDIAELLGIAAIVASLIFVGLQLRQDQAIAQVQNFADFDDTMIEYSRVINANRDIWIRGLLGEELNQSEKVAFEAVGFAVFQKFAGLHRRTEAMPRGRPPREIARQLAHEMHIYPGLERYISLRCTHLASMGFNPQFCRDVMDQLSDVKAGKYPPVEGRLFVL